MHQYLSPLDRRFKWQDCASVTQFHMPCKQLADSSKNSKDRKNKFNENKTWSDWKNHFVRRSAQQSFLWNFFLSSWQSQLVEASFLLAVFFRFWGLLSVQLASRFYFVLVFTASPQARSRVLLASFSSSVSGHPFGFSSSNFISSVSFV